MTPSPETASEAEISEAVPLTELENIESDPPEREFLRGFLAKSLIYCFVGQMAAPFIILLKWPDQIESILKILTITVSPTVAILGAVMGFYYGSKPNSY